MSTLKVNRIIPVAGVPSGGGGGIIQTVTATTTSKAAEDCSTNTFQNGF